MGLLMGLLQIIFWLFWTISPTRMGLVFKLTHWIVHPLHMGVFEYLFGSIWGCPNGPNSIKNYFLVVLDHFSYKNGPIDLVRGSFSCYDIRPYILSTCGSLCTFWGPFGGAQKTMKINYFLVVLVHFSYKNGPIDLVRGLFLS
jgi:hypothetical protein